MSMLKLFSGLLLLILGILFLKLTNKSKRKGEKNDIDDLIVNTTATQGYIISFVLIVIGVGLIISCFYV